MVNLHRIGVTLNALSSVHFFVLHAKNDVFTIDVTACFVNLKIYSGLKGQLCDKWHI